MNSAGANSLQYNTVAWDNVSSNCTTGNMLSQEMTTYSMTTTDDPNLIIGSCKIVLCQEIREGHLYGFCEMTLGDFVDEMERERLYLQSIPTTSKVLLSVMCAIIILLSLCGNSLVVLTFIFNKHMRSVTNVFILSLAVSDLMVTFTCIPINMGEILAEQWIFGRFGCKLLPCVSQLSVACSSLTLCCIAFDRYYAIVHPLKLKFLQTTKRATILQVVVWCISASSTIPYALFYDTLELSTCKGFVDDDTKFKEVCLARYYGAAKKVFDVWVTMFVLFYGPFLFMTIMYSIVCYKLWVQRPIGVTSLKNHDGRLKIKRKAIKMLITVVFIYVICWSPLLWFIAIAQTSHVPTTVSTINWRSFLQCLALSSTCWNPLVYAFMNEKFRKAFRTLLSFKIGQVHPAIVRNNVQRLSTESRKTTTQLETPTLPLRSGQTSETKV